MENFRVVVGDYAWECGDMFRAMDIMFNELTELKDEFFEQHDSFMQDKHTRIIPQSVADEWDNMILDTFITITLNDEYMEQMEEEVRCDVEWLLCDRCDGLEIWDDDTYYNAFALHTI